MRASMTKAGFLIEGRAASLSYRTVTQAAKDRVHCREVDRAFMSAVPTPSTGLCPAQDGSLPTCLRRGDGIVAMREACRRSRLTQATKA